jgi:predicted outer membrane repeat protein
LQNALAIAQSGDQIWVMAGTYYPTTTDPDLRTATFQLESGVAIYGGFAGTENSLEQRDWVNNPSTLSGDIGDPDVNTDNSYHVVTGSGVNATAILDGFTITAGNADGYSTAQMGGGLYNVSGSPTLTNLILSGNSARYGAGMYNSYSNPTLTNVTFSGNTATYFAGGLHNIYSDPTLTNVTFHLNSAVTGSAGGMGNEYSSPTLNNVTFSENSADGDSGQWGYAGGGMCNFSSSSPTLTDVSFSGNSASYGGGMRNDSNSNPTLSNVTFDQNTASFAGGGMHNLDASPILTNVTFTDNNGSHNGGGMFNESASNQQLSDVTFSGNTAYYGGGIKNNLNSCPILTNVIFAANVSTDGGGGMRNNASSPILTDVTFINNNGGKEGGGLHNEAGSNPILNNVTFSANLAPKGGGMYDSASSPTLTNVTFSGNIASVCGGGIYNENLSNPHLTNVTFSGNEATELNGGGMYSNTDNNPTLINAILWENTPDQIFNVSSTTTISYSVVQGGWTGGTNIIDQDPFLDPLADNGGSTLTHALREDSPAIDAGDPLNCPATDQRGFPRPIDGDGDGTAVCDMGAYEYVPTIEVFACTDEMDVPKVECEALVALYNNTNGAGWIASTNWMVIDAPISTWFGVTVSGGNVTGIDLNTNNLSGGIPTEIGNLTSLYQLNLSNNLLTGDVPSSFTSLVNLCEAGNTVSPCDGTDGLDLGYNRLNVPAPEPPAAFLDQKDPDWHLTQTIETEIPAAGGTIISNDANTVIVIPPGAVDTDTTFLLSSQLLPSQDTGSFSFVGNSFELTAWQGETPVTSFIEPLILTLHYDEANLGGVPEDSLILSYWDSGLSEWVDAVTTCVDGVYTRNFDEDWLSLPLCHLSEFALLGIESSNLFLPLILR